MLLGLMALVFALSAPSLRPGHEETAAGPVSAPPRAGLLYRGSLDFPALRTESFFQGGSTPGSELAVLEDPRSDPLRLSVACPGGSRAAVGTEHESVRVNTRAGRCVVTIWSSAANHGRVPFRLTMHRSPS